MVPRVVLRRIEELHKTHAALDQSTCQQALTAKKVGRRVTDAIEFTGRGALTRDIESLRCFAMHAKRQVEGSDPRFELAVDDALTLVELVEASQGIEFASLTPPIAGEAGAASAVAEGSHNAIRMVAFVLLMASSKSIARHHSRCQAPI